MSPRTGALRHRLTLEAPQRNEAEGGAADIAWSEVAGMWADILPLSGREAAENDALRGVLTHEITIRHRPGLDATMRFRGTGGRIFEIRAVRDLDERRRWLVCACEERLP
jgi:SPP1 family predicted phage head-tail adaptor